VQLGLISKIYNLCGPDPPTSQTDGQTHTCTDDMRLQDGALQYSASRANGGKIRASQMLIGYIADNVSLKYRYIIH